MEQPGKPTCHTDGYSGYGELAIPRDIEGLVRYCYTLHEQSGAILTGLLPGGGLGPVARAVFKTVVGGDEPPRWVRLPCALALIFWLTKARLLDGVL